MKKINLLLKSLFIVTLCLGFSSCETEPLEGEFGKLNPPNNSNFGSLSAEIDGVPFVAEAAAAMWSPSRFFPGGQTTVIQGAKDVSSNIKTINMTIEDDKGIIPGSYPLNVMGELNTPGVGMGAYTISDLATEAQGWLTGEMIGGTLTITEVDRANERIKGTFEFDAERLGDDNTIPAMISITKGKFDMPLLEVH
ncbi:DUF6252 family protein [Mesonia sediminis]|uniref:DUF6252 family protein n=1 Tax=Mesonia sediminis TaxID=1703946 RepID=A0ABW5SCD4_9FLAO